MLSSCLETRLLREFRYGTLEDESRSEQIAEHLAACPACEEQFAKIPPQPLVQWLFRRANQPNLTTPPAPLPEQDWGGFPPPAALLEHHKWECLRLLGKGGMSAAYLARQRQFPERLRAIKLLQPQFMAREQLTDRFRREILVTLDQLPAHENIVRGYDAEVLDSYLLLVMEHVSGENLEQVASRQPDGRLPFPLACGYMLQALQGLAHAAQHHVVHRDLKPSNLMLSSQGVVKILDFGLAKILSGADSGLTSDCVEFCGTAKYCSPEQAHDFAQADVRSDLYSLGCTLYRLIAGVPPFGEHTGHASTLAVFQAHNLDTPVPLDERCPAAPPELSRVVARLLAKHPDDRYRTTEEAFAALLPFADAASQQRYPAIQAPPSAVPEVFDAAAGMSTKAISANVYAITGVALLLLICLAVWEVFSGGRHPPRIDIPHPEAEATTVPPSPSPPSPPASRLAAFGRSSGKTWRIDGGELIVDSSSEEWLLFGDPTWTDYAFTCEAKSAAPGKGLSVLFRAQQDGRAYSFTLGADHNQARRLELVDSHRAGTQVAEERPDPESLRPDHWHSLRIEVTGSRVRCMLDDIKKFDVEDIAFDQGRVGLRVNGSSARFRHLSVQNADGALLWSGLPELPRSVRTPDPPELAMLPLAPQFPLDGPAVTAPASDVVVVDEDAEPLLFGKANWSDYDFTCQFRLEPTLGDLQFFCRASDAENSVRIALGAFGNNRHEIGIIRKGQRGSASRSVEGKLVPGWHDMEIRARGDKIECSLDGLKVLDFRQEEMPTGKVGIAVGRGRARFRQLRVISPDGTVLWEQN